MSNAIRARGFLAEKGKDKGSGGGGNSKSKKGGSGSGKGGYSSKPSSSKRAHSASRKMDLEELKAKSICNRCGQKGHWAEDDVCPMKPRSAIAASSSSAEINWSFWGENPPEAEEVIQEVQAEVDRRQPWTTVKVKQEDQPNFPQKRLRPNPAVREALQNSGVFEARSASAKPRAAPQSPRAPPPPWRVKKEVHMTLHSVLSVNVERDFRLLTIDTPCETSVTGLSCL